jgi:hypothetical protein
MLILADLGFLRASHGACTKISLKLVAFPRSAWLAEVADRAAPLGRLRWRCGAIRERNPSGRQMTRTAAAV